MLRSHKLYTEMYGKTYVARIIKKHEKDYLIENKM